MKKAQQALLALVAVALTVGVAAPVAQADDPPAPTCDTRTVSTKVGLASWTVSGTYCRPAAGAPDSVFVLVPGATYSREYWDFQYQPETYSFSRALVRDGYATFAIDRVGTGQSSKPLSLTVTSSAQASAVHQVVSRLRGAGFDGHGFSRVLLAGHSAGSGISILEAATFGDVDGLVVTGLAHRLNLPALTTLASSLYPAILDPKYAGTTLDVGYLTTRPGMRKPAFHDPGQVDPGVIAHDEATKDVFSATELPDAVALGVLLSYSDRITAPVMVLVGDADGLICGTLGSDCRSAATLLAQEQPFYSNARCLSAVTMPGVGHDVNLHPTAPVAQQRVADWADAIAGGGCPPAG
jgi:pimeloyl-ACP methyl ester carboxylesterase